MAYAPFNIGFSQGRAIRLGSSRSLKVYRGSRELGSSDPILTIHDAFGGSGYLDGRTPDTVDNGNTWSTSVATGWPVSSGYTYYTSGDLAALIDPGTSVYQIVAETYTTATLQHGIWLRFDGPTIERSTIFLNSTMTLLQTFERVGGTNYVTTLATGLSGLTNQTLTWTLDVNGTSVDYDFSASGSSIASGTWSMLNTPADIGPFHANTGTAVRTLDFKVYA